MTFVTVNNSYDNLDKNLKEKITFEQYKMLFAYYRKENEELKINNLKKENSNSDSNSNSNSDSNSDSNSYSKDEDSDSYSKDEDSDSYSNLNSYSKDEDSEEDIYNVLLFTRSKSVSSKPSSKLKSRSRSKSVPVPSKSRHRFTNNNINLLGSGTYGCVISNPICNKNYIIKEYIPYNDIDNNDIGKIYKKGDLDDKESFNDELDILLKIKKIDPFNYFTVKLKAAFNFYGNIIAQEKHLLTSLEVEVKVNNSIINEIFYQIILENGGVHLDKFNKISYKKFLKLFKKFLQGMIKLNENKLVHTDIKPDNILITKTKINLIDFGCMIPAKVLYNDENNFRLSTYYSVYPPEFYIASILSKCKNNISKKLDNILNIMIKRNYFDKKNIPEFYKKIYYSGIQKFIKHIKLQNLTNYNDIFTEKLALQSDIYSLSFIISNFYNIIHDMTEQEKDFMLGLVLRCQNANPYTRIDIYSLYLLVNNEYNK
jgi:serine/threonine protein kinase